MPGKLVVRGQNGGRTVYPLAPGLTAIGRDAENDIVVPVGAVSRFHAKVEWAGGQFFVSDAGSRHGTYRNGRRIAEPEPLEHGDVIVLAGQTFVFDAEEATEEWQPEAPPATETLRVDTDAGKVWLNGEEVKLTAKEYLALSLLYRKAGKLVSKEELAAGVWPELNGDVGDYNIEKQIGRLRGKIEIAPGHPRYLFTVRKLGYRLELGTAQ